jgi:hypothetical protein
MGCTSSQETRQSEEGAARDVYVDESQPEADRSAAPASPPSPPPPQLSSIEQSDERAVYAEPPPTLLHYDVTAATPEAASPPPVTCVAASRVPTLGVAVSFIRYDDPDYASR